MRTYTSGSILLDVQVASSVRKHVWSLSLAFCVTEGAPKSLNVGFPAQDFAERFAPSSFAQNKPVC